MNRLKLCLVATALALAAIGSGCSREIGRQATAPLRPGPDPSMIRDAHWITSAEELRGLTARAGKSPLMARAVELEATDPDLELHASGVVGATASTTGGDRIRITMIPYQSRSDPDHARYFVLNEWNGQARAETFDLLRRRPRAGEEGFLPVNGAAHGLWIRPGSTYAQAASRSGHLAPERFNWAKFGVCFATVGDMVVGAVNAACSAMGDWPGCRAIGDGVGLAGAAGYCGIMAWG
jgi:hypothetical protein